MSQSWLKMSRASVAMRVKSKLLSRAHNVSCLGFQFHFSTLFPTLSSSLPDYHSAQVTMLVPTSGPLPILFPLGTFSQDHSAGSDCYFRSELKCHLLWAIAQLFLPILHFEVESAFKYPNLEKMFFGGKGNLGKWYLSLSHVSMKKLDAMGIISIFHLRKVLIKTFLWITSCFSGLFASF